MQPFGHTQCRGNVLLTCTYPKEKASVVLVLLGTSSLPQFHNVFISKAELRLNCSGFLPAL